jgi:MFS family permease
LIEQMNAQPVSDSKAPKNLALQLILLMGLVSALGDITYETGRSTSGPYLAFLGASAFVIGLTSGLGEFLGYALRLASGYLADRTRAYWIATFIGYGLILSIPLLAYTDRWEWAVVLLLLERIGKAIRSPARDTILSHATHQVGRGWGFAIHEAMDQVGAVIGPLIFAAVFVQRNSYRDAFSILWIPAILTMIILLAARLRVPAPEKLEKSNQPEATVAGRDHPALPRIFWTYALFTFLGVAGFANFQIISYHLVNRAVVPAAQIPVLYAVAMGVDALAALVVGKAYDKMGLKSLIIVPFVTLPLPFLAFSQRYELAVVSAVLWGIVMAGHETVMRAAIADLVPVGRRAFAYGIFNTVYGTAWFVSGVLLGLLYDVSSFWMIAYVVVVEAGALLVFARLRATVEE